MKKQFNFYLILVLIVPVFCSCGIFKSRIVNLNKKDSTVIEQASKTFHVDSEKTTTEVNNTIIQDHSTDSSSIKVIIKPLPGVPFTLDPDGTFHGQASDVQTQVHNYKKTDINSNSNNKKINKLSVIKDSTVHSNKKTVLTTKVKSVTAKPDYSWIIYLVALISFIILITWLYHLFESKIKNII